MMQLKTSIKCASVSGEESVLLYSSATALSAGPFLKKRATAWQNQKMMQVRSSVIISIRASDHSLCYMRLVGSLGYNDDISQQK